MNTYHAFYKGKKIEIKAETSYQAECLAAIQLKAKNNWDVTIILVALDGAQVEHSTASVG